MDRAIHFLRHHIKQTQHRLDTQKAELAAAQEEVARIAEEVAITECTLKSLGDAAGKLESLQGQ